MRVVGDPNTDLFAPIPNGVRQPILREALLDDALEGSCAVVGVVASLGQEIPRVFADIDFEPSLSQSRTQAR